MGRCARNAGTLIGGYCSLITYGAAGHENENNCTTSVCTEPSLQGPQTETPSDCFAAIAIPSRTIAGLPSKVYHQLYALRNREQINKRSRAWEKAHPEVRRRKCRRSRQRRRAQILNMYGSACVLCGLTDPEVLDLDHVCGGGSRERANGMRTQGIYGQVLRGDRPSDDFRLLCRNCNWKEYLARKRRETECQQSTST